MRAFVFTLASLTLALAAAAASNSSTTANRTVLVPTCVGTLAGVPPATSSAAAPGQAAVYTLGKPYAAVQTPHGGLWFSAYDANGAGWLYAVNPNGALEPRAGGVVGPLVVSGEAKSVPFYGTSFVLHPTDGSIWFPALCTVQRIDRSMYLTTPVATSAVCGYGGDGGPAAAALVNLPQSVAFSPDGGTLYIADTTNNCIRAVSDGGLGRIYMVAGSGTARGWSGDGGPATAALLYAPKAALALDGGASLYIADTTNNVIRVIRDGIISTLIGSAPPYNYSGSPMPYKTIYDDDHSRWDVRGFSFRYPYGMISDFPPSNRTFILGAYTQVWRVDIASRSGVLLAGVHGSRGYTGHAGKRPFDDEKGRKG